MVFESLRFGYLANSIVDVRFFSRCSEKRCGRKPSIIVLYSPRSPSITQFRPGPCALLYRNAYRFRSVPTVEACLREPASMGSVTSNQTSSELRSLSRQETCSLGAIDEILSCQALIFRIHGHAHADAVAVVI